MGTLVFLLIVGFGLYRMGRFAVQNPSTTLQGMGLIRALLKK